MASGIVFDIKRFALHDGPGLRTTVFLKGCPLSCLGCHNPEGQGMGPELLFRPDRCTLCGDCVPACPHQALALKGGALEVARDRCELAARCVEACLPGALEMVGRRVTAGEILALVEEDRVFYDESGGGVTFSGGEPFSQAEFLREVLAGCRERELGVVLDTCGHVAPEIFRELALLASHLLFDLKLMDPDRHQAFTGVHNRWVLENLAWAAGAAEAGGTGGTGGTGEAGRTGAARAAGASDGGPALTVRIPLIPGVNDDAENLGATGVFLAGLTPPPPVDLLPYHRLGVDKYHRMGRDYGLPDAEPPGSSRVKEAVRILREAGLEVTVRGEHHGHD